MFVCVIFKKKKVLCWLKVCIVNMIENSFIKVQTVLSVSTLVLHVIFVEIVKKIFFLKNLEMSETDIAGATTK